MSNPEKRRAIFDYHRVNADFLICQETHSCRDTQQIWTNEWGGGAIYSHGTSAARGIAIFHNKTLKGSICNIFTDEAGRVIIIDVEENGAFTTIAAIYAPNEDNPNFFVQIRDQLKLRHDNKIIIGDFNFAMNNEVDRLNTYNNNTKARDKVEDIMDEFSLKDIWRIQNPERREYSWRKKGNLNKASRIDFVLISAGLDQKAKMVQYISSIMTDHRAIYLVLEMEASERGTGYWKFNNSLLQIKEYIDIMNKSIEQCLDEHKTKSAACKWETLKVKIKKVSTEFARNKVTEDKLIIAQLSEKVNEYEASLPLNKEDNQILQYTKAGT